jgi:hypothetical protein
MMMNVEQLVEWELAGETEVLRETCPNATLSTQIPHDQTRAWTWTTVVGSRRLTAWAMAWPFVWSYICDITQQELWLRSSNLWQIENMEIDCWFGDSSGMSCVRSEISYINLTLFSNIIFEHPVALKEFTVWQNPQKGYTWWWLIIAETCCVYINEWTK